MLQKLVQIYRSAIAELAVMRMNVARFVNVLDPPFNGNMAATIEMELQSPWVEADLRKFLAH